MAAKPYDLTTLEDVKAYLSGSAPMGNDDNDFLQGRISAASVFMLRDMNRVALKAASYKEQFVGNGKRTFTPRQDHVISVESVKVNGVDVPASADGITSGFVLIKDDNSEQLLLRGGYEFTADAICEVNYTAGFDSVPEDVADACMKLVALRYRERKRVGLVSEALPQGAGTASYTQKDVTDDVRSVIEQYTLRF